MVLEISDGPELRRAAVEYVENDDAIPDEERTHTVSAVSDDIDGAAEAIAYLVDPIELVRQAPGVELAQASWSSETIDFDPDGPSGPDSPVWFFGSGTADGEFVGGATGGSTGQSGGSTGPR